MAVVGGSVTAGVGVVNSSNSYVSRVYDWVNTTFHHPGHRFQTIALPATTSAYYAPCVTSTGLANDTELVLLEFTFNDSEMAFFHHQIDDRTRLAVAPWACAASCGQGACGAWLVAASQRVRHAGEAWSAWSGRSCAWGSQPALLYYHYWPPLWPLYHGSYWQGGEHYSEVGCSS